MKEAGCRRVYLGLESGSQATLRLMNKQATLDEGISAVHAYRRAGIEVAASFLVGYPGETVASIEETFKLSALAAFDEISFTCPSAARVQLFARLGGPDEARTGPRRTRSPSSTPRDRRALAAGAGSQRP